MTIVLEPTELELRAERDDLLARTRMDEQELRDRAAHFLLTPDEARIARRLNEIDFLLGE